MDNYGQFLFIAVCLAIFTRFVFLTMRGVAEQGIVSALACLMYLMCLFVSAHLQAIGLTTTKLLIAHSLPPTSPYEIDGLSFNWAIELAIIFVTDVLTSLKYFKRRRLSIDVGSSASVYLNFVQQKAAILLVAVGLVATLVFRTALEDRATGGQGAVTMLKNCLIVGLSLMAFNNFFRKKMFYVIAIAGILLLVAASVRSPLLSIAFSFFAGKLARREITPPILLRFTVLGIILAMLAATMSIYRKDVIEGHTASLSNSFLTAVQNPFAAVYGNGLDTLDGYRLAAQINDREPAQPLNVLVAVTTFVPRAIWPDKPDDLSLEITNRYLGWGKGGIFLSLVGYLRLAFGGYPQALIALAVLMLILCSIYKKKYDKYSGFITILIVFFLFLGGSPFSVYYGLVFLAIYGLGCVPFMAYWAATRRRRRRIAWESDRGFVTEDAP